jgi:hypothetical protein
VHIIQTKTIGGKLPHGGGFLAIFSCWFLSKAFRSIVVS